MEEDTITFLAFILCMVLFFTVFGLILKYALGPDLEEVCSHYEVEDCERVMCYVDHTPSGRMKVELLNVYAECIKLDYLIEQSTIS